MVVILLLSIIKHGQPFEEVEVVQNSFRLRQEPVSGSIIKTFYLKAASLITHRAVACGYNRELPEKPSVWHVYPSEGVSTLCNNLAEGLEGSIRLQSPVQEILIGDEKVIGVRANGNLFEFSATISTAPANVLPKLVKGTTALERVSRFRFRPMVFVNMRFKGRGQDKSTRFGLAEFRTFPELLKRITGNDVYSFASRSG